MAAVGVFAVVDYDAGVQEGGAEGVEEGGEAAGLRGGVLALVLGRFGEEGAVVL